MAGGRKSVGIAIVRRVLVPPQPGAGPAATHDYTPVIASVRAEVRTTGYKGFSDVVIDGKKVTHVFTLRWTTIPIDTRDRVRDAVGALYQILSADHVGEGRRSLRLLCCRAGDETVPSVR